MKITLLFLLLSISIFCFSQSDQNYQMEILNDEIIMRKKCQDAIEIQLYFSSDSCVFGKTLVLPKYVESNTFACACLDLGFDLDDLPVPGLGYFLENAAGEIVYSNEDAVTWSNYQPKLKPKMVVPLVGDNLRIKKIDVALEDYPTFMESNQVTVSSDTIVSVYPLINWTHYGIKKGGYKLFLVYRNVCIGENSFDGQLISNKVRLIIK